MKHVTIIGIVPENLTLGVELSDAGQQGMEKGIALLLEELAALDVPLAPAAMAVAGGG